MKNKNVEQILDEIENEFKKKIIKFNSDFGLMCTIG